MKRYLTLLMPFLLAACTIRMGDESPAGKWQSGNFRGYCQDVFAAAATKDAGSLSDIVRVAADASASDVDSFASLFASMVKAASGDRELKRAAEVAAPYARNVFTSIEAWTNGAEPIYFGCAVVTRSDGSRRFVLNLNSDLAQLRRLMLDDLQTPGQQPLRSQPPSLGI